MDKFAKVVLIGFKIFSGIAAGYFVYKAVNEKADELAQDGGMLNAFMIGAGETAVVTAAGALAYYMVG